MDSAAPVDAEFGRKGNEIDGQASYGMNDRGQVFRGQEAPALEDGAIEIIEAGRAGSYPALPETVGEERVMNEKPDSAVAGSGSSGGLSRRRLLGISGAAGLMAVGAAATPALASSGGPKALQSRTGEQGAARVTAPPPQGVLGANFNGDPRIVNFAELRDVSATWLRGFVPMPDTEKGDPAEHPNIRKLLRAGAQGYGTVLSLKFPYTKKPIPTPGSPAMKAEIKRLDKVLPAVMGKVDILAIGNEPFIESRAEDQDDRINVFYETIARHVIAFRDKQAGASAKTQLYMGSLNRLDLPDWRTPATARWMTFVHDTPALMGVDIHPHLPERGADQKYLDYILPRMRPDQKFLATEFSMVLFWRKHLKDDISTEFADRYHVRRGTPVWKVIKQAIDHPFTQSKWDDFLAMSPWFDSNRNYMREQMETFRRTGKLAVATYGVGQDAAMVEDFGPKSTPWLLNSLFCPHTVQRGEDGLPGRNRTWTDQFRALQHG